MHLKKTPLREPYEEAVSFEGEMRYGVRRNYVLDISVRNKKLYKYEKIRKMNPK